MNILFLGSMVPSQYEMKVPRLSAAGNQFQNNLVNAYKKEHNVKVLSFIAVSVINNEINDEAKKENINITFATNRKIIAIIEFRKLLHEWLEWADCVVTYNYLYAWAGIGKIAKKRKLKSILILADFTPSVEEKSVVRKLYAKMAEFEFQQYEKVITLSGNSKKYLSSSQDNITVNGCIKWDDFKEIKEPIFENIINIVYTGVLTKVTGIDLLIEGFMTNRNPQYRLIICGQGDELEKLITKAQNIDNRIIFKGYVERNEYIQILSKAHILVNPRNMNLLQNQNNFPSKVLEYLATGRSIISTRFPGYESYSKYINFVEATPSDIMKGIEDISFGIEKNAGDIYCRNRDFAKMQTWENMVDIFL